MLDAPVSGGTGGAQAGTLTFMVGGSEQAFRARQAASGKDGQDHRALPAAQATARPPRSATT
jgi:3-hydroxyisobutyrate dehydrogenase-like beta-hydroxyacid dehydrogenase